MSRQSGAPGREEGGDDGVDPQRLKEVGGERGGLGDSRVLRHDMSASSPSWLKVQLGSRSKSGQVKSIGVSDLVDTGSRGLGEKGSGRLVVQPPVSIPPHRYIAKISGIVRHIQVAKRGLGVPDILGR